MTSLDNIIPKTLLRRGALCHHVIKTTIRYTQVSRRGLEKIVGGFD